MPAEHDDRSCNGSGCRSSDTLDKGSHLRVSGETFVERAHNDHEKVYGQEHTQCGSPSNLGPRDEVTDEGHSNHYRTGCNHRDRDSIEELGFRKPVMLLYHTPVKKRDNRQPAAKYKQARFHKEEEQR